MRKTKIMVVSDWLGAGTGFSEELRHVMFRLAQSGLYEIYWLGVFYMGAPLSYPDSMFPDIPHRGASIKTLSGWGPIQNYGVDGFKRNYELYSPDLVIGMGDPRHFQPYLEEKNKVGGLKFPYVVYTTLDGTPIPRHWVDEETSVFKGANVILSMTEWAMLEYQKAGVPVNGYIHHGVNWDYMTTSKFEKQRVRKMYGISDDTVLFTNWDVPQYRKRTDALLACWKAFRPESKDAKLFLYADSNCEIGWDLENLIKTKDIPRDTVLLPEDVYGRRKDWRQAEEMEFHRMMCSMGDVFVSTTSGEGFGKCALEALSFGIPPIITDYSACSEVCEQGSILVPPYDGPAGRYRIHDGIRNVEGAVVNQEKFVEAMTRLYDNPGERTELGRQGRLWSQTFNYDTHIVPGWIDSLERINPDVIFADEVLKGLN